VKPVLTLLISVDYVTGEVYVRRFNRLRTSYQYDDIFVMFF